MWPRFWTNPEVLLVVTLHHPGGMRLRKLVDMPGLLVPGSMAERLTLEDLVTCLSFRNAVQLGFKIIFVLSMLGFGRTHNAKEAGRGASSQGLLADHLSANASNSALYSPSSAGDAHLPHVRTHSHCHTLSCPCACGFECLHRDWLALCH